MADEPLPARQLESARERVIDTLSTHFANDDLSMEELERRIERVYAAQTQAAITEVLAGLPVLGAAAAPAAVPVVVESLPAPVSPRGRNLIAFMSGIVRRGAWIVPERLRAVAFMGGVEIDLRAAQLPPVTTIYAAAVMGGIVITVPPGARVEADGFAIMGGFEDQLERHATHDPTARVVRVTGFALMGGVEVKVAERTGPDTTDAA
jgi:hypothetical protein